MNKSVSVKSVARLISDEGFYPYVSRYGYGIASLSALDSDYKLVVESNRCSESYVIRIFNSL